MRSSNIYSTPFDADSSIPTVYDETYRGKSFAQPTILTVAEGFEAHMSGRLEHHAYGTDGSFQISLAGGEGTYISQELLDAIPFTRRPILNREDAGRSIGTTWWTATPLQSVGSVMLPFTVTKFGSNERVRLVVYALVVPNLLISMVISCHTNSFVLRQDTWGGRYMITMDFGYGERMRINGM